MKKQLCGFAETCVTITLLGKLRLTCWAPGLNARARWKSHISIGEKTWPQSQVSLQPLYHSCFSRACVPCECIVTFMPASGRSLPKYQSSRTHTGKEPMAISGGKCVQSTKVGQANQFSTIFLAYLYQFDLRFHLSRLLFRFTFRTPCLISSCEPKPLIQLKQYLRILRGLQLAGGKAWSTTKEQTF